ncbi:unnamed protein product [Ambrosiozyma monospora]|uniref:Unnamed protein product n=1 Tax=Ambrosiozyma monospora TaxID=43982 RepID=A0A9W6Z6P4_AMBMO|nr:unnamed protein product [Ambrosiozyma monospora]
MYTSTLFTVATFLLSAMTANAMPIAQAQTTVVNPFQSGSVSATQTSGQATVTVHVEIPIDLDGATGIPFPITNVWPKTGATVTKYIIDTVSTPPIYLPTTVTEPSTTYTSLVPTEPWNN